MYILAQENEKLQDKKIQVHLFKCQEKGGGGSSLEIWILNNERVYTHTQVINESKGFVWVGPYLNIKLISPRF